MTFVLGTGDTAEGLYPPATSTAPPLTLPPYMPPTHMPHPHPGPYYPQQPESFSPPGPTSMPPHSQPFPPPGATSVPPQSLPTQPTTPIGYQLMVLSCFPYCAILCRCQSKD